MPDRFCRLIHGDALGCLRRLEAGSVSCCVTSPPYFGLRDYGSAGQIGLEATPDEYAARLVEVFREVRRVLRGDGTLWLNLGDSYAGSGRGGYVGEASTLEGSTDGQSQVRLARGSQKAAGLHEEARQAGAVGRAWVPPPRGLKQKDLIGVPWLVAFALRADGWWLRQDIIWAKPNPMPESVRDRCTKAHEYVFLLAKSERYACDMEAIKEEAVASHPAGNKHGFCKGRIGATSGWNTRPADPVKSMPDERNKRSVWTINPKPYAGAHFAVMPPELATLCIKAGCPEGGVVLDPFAGSGTTCATALKLGRSTIGIDLNRDYLALAERRCREAAEEMALYEPYEITVEAAHA